MTLAREHGLTTIAFPLISAGAYGYPVKEAIKVALTVLMEYADTELKPSLVLYDMDTYFTALEVFRKRT